MKRTHHVLENATETDAPNKKRRKINNESNTNNKQTENESKENMLSDFEHIAFYLTKSSFTDNKDGKYEFNKYSLCLDDIITSSSSIISKCIIFSFKIDIEWIFASCPILKNKQIVEQVYLLHGESLDSHYNFVNYQLIYDHLRIYKIKMNFSYGTHHTKMIFLLYKNEGIRIVITSANMIQRDWCYKINGIYLQDFPLKTKQQLNTNNTSEFGSTLYEYCNKLHGLNNKLVMNFDFLNNYDFNSAKILLIPSVPGYHKQTDLSLFGHRRLRYLLSKYNIKTNDDNLIINISSIGSLTEQWFMDEFFRSSFYGQNNKNIFNQNKMDSNVKILWPTVENVRNSIEGYSAGGSLCFSNKCYKPFLVKYFNKYNAEISGRKHLMPHIKTYSVVNIQNKKVNFFILTSANLSTAAWGKLQKNSSQLFIRSFEMGCLYLPQVYVNYMKHKHRGFNLTDLPFKNIKRNLNTNNKCDHMNDNVEFEIMYQLNKSKNKVLKEEKRKIIFPIPMEIIDTQKYKKEDKPWIWDLQYQKSDMYGQRWPHQ